MPPYQEKIYNNPFRILGVYANASIKDIKANEAKAKAFLNVGREVTYPCDFNQLLSPIQRTAEMMASANSQLTLPNEKIKYALFWFVKVTPLDEIAFSHLANGHTSQAIEIWEKKKCFSSLLNISVLSLIQGQFIYSVQNMLELLSTDTFRNDFIRFIIDDTFQISEDVLAHTFLDAFTNPAYAKALLSDSTFPNKYKGYIKDKLVAPVITDIESEITKAKSIKRENSSARYNAGVQLINLAKNKLAELKKLLFGSDMRYQIIADKLGLEILQCGIDYYNNSDDADSAHKAMKLQSYAQSVVVGQMAKDRCKQNTDILKKIIAELPPMEVLEEDKIINRALKSFAVQVKTKKLERARYYGLPETSVDDLNHVSTLIRAVKPSLNSMKAKQVAGSKYYSQIIDLIVNVALSEVIDYVNIYNNQQLEMNLILDRENTLRKLRNAIRNSMVIMSELESFDMSYTFRSTRFNPNRDILNRLRNQLGISSPSNNNSGSNSGCMIWIVIAFALGVLVSCI